MLVIVDKANTNLRWLTGHVLQEMKTITFVGLYYNWSLSKMNSLTWSEIPLLPEAPLEWDSN